MLLVSFFFFSFWFPIYCWFFNIHTDARTYYSSGSEQNMKVFSLQKKSFSIYGFVKSK